MKRTLLLTICALMIASVAMADHIGIFSDATGQSCNLGNIAGQFSSSATVIHQFASGATGSRFRIQFPAGTLFFSFNNTTMCGTQVGTAVSDISISYCACLSGNIVLGNILAVYGAGTLEIRPADTVNNILYTDCSFVEHAATGGTASVNGIIICYDGDPLAVESSTWGSVKSLYR